MKNKNLLKSLRFLTNIYNRPNQNLKTKNRKIISQLRNIKRQRKKNPNGKKK